MSCYYTFVNGTATYKIGRLERAIARGAEIADRCRKQTVEISKDGQAPFLDVFFDSRVGAVVFAPSRKEKKLVRELSDIQYNRKVAEHDGQSAKRLKVREQTLYTELRNMREVYRNGVLRFQ